LGTFQTVHTYKAQTFWEQYYKIFYMKVYACNINVYLGKIQHTTDDETTVTQATVRCHIPLPLINHQNAPK